MLLSFGVQCSGLWQIYVHSGGPCCFYRHGSWVILQEHTGRIYSEILLKWTYLINLCISGVPCYIFRNWMCNIYCFSTATMVALTRFIITLYVHCLSCLILCLYFLLYSDDGGRKMLKNESRRFVESQSWSKCFKKERKFRTERKLIPYTVQSMK